MSQDTNICPGNCGAGQGFGTCNEDSGQCSCSMGWTGPDCTDATCCPLWVLIGIGCVVALSIGAFIVWRFFWLCGFHKVFPSRPDTAKPVKPMRPNKLSKLSSKSSLTVAAHDSGSSLPKSRSTTSVTLEFGATGPQQSAQDANAGRTQRRGTAPAMTMAGAAQRGSVDSASQSPQRSKSQQEGVLRSSAWGEEPPGVGRPQADTSIPKLRRAQTEACLGSAGRSQADGVGASMGRSQTGEAPSGGATASQPSAGFGAARRGSSSSESLPHVPVREDESSPHVKQVEKKMRDMMDHPLLVRKKTLKDLLVEHHPDKNPDEHATEVFQAVNNARSWFLHGAEPEPRKEAGM